jgi:hypothetical protein
LGDIVKKLFSVTAARWLTFAGLVALAICVLATAFDSYLSWYREEADRAAPIASPGKAPSGPRAGSTVPNCKDELTEALDPKSSVNTNSATPDGKLRVVGVWPRTVRLGGQLCVVVAGVVSKGEQQKLADAVETKEQEITALQNQLAAADDKTKPDLQKKLVSAKDGLSQAKAAKNQGQPPVELSLFLNGRRSPLSRTVPAESEPQLVIYDFGQSPDATSKDAEFWRAVLGSKTQSGLMPVRVGISKSQSSIPEAEYDKPIQFRAYWFSIVAIGALSMVCLFAAFAIYAAKSTVLRDHTLTKRQLAEQEATTAREAANKEPANAKLEADAQAKEKALRECGIDADVPAGTFSLGRTQMALWLGLATAGFVFIWLTLGLYKNVITEAILVLLGINSLTGLTAALLDKDDTGKAISKMESKGFWFDLCSDGEGVKLQRIQMIVWTGILAVIFVWNVLANFVFVEFDTYLLLLMGIVNSTYLGFKTFEKKPAPVK